MSRHGINLRPVSVLVIGQTDIRSSSGLFKHCPVSPRVHIYGTTNEIMDMVKLMGKLQLWMNMKLSSADTRELADMKRDGTLLPRKFSLTC